MTDPNCSCFRNETFLLARLDRWRIFLNPNQDYLGRSLIALNRHEEDLLTLTADEREELWAAVRHLREAMQALFQPDHFNYQVLGNSLRHVHMHVTPRYSSPREFAGQTFADEHWGTWPYPAEASRPHEWLESVLAALRRELSQNGA